MLSRTTSRKLSFKRSRALSVLSLEDSRPTLELQADPLLVYEDEDGENDSCSLRSSTRSYQAISTCLTNSSDLETGNEPPENPHEPKVIISEFKVKIIALCLFSNVYLASVDSTMVATLLSVIASDLDEMSNISWVATSYLLSCAAFQPLFGKLSDVFGRKVILLVCTFLFSFGCLMCGLSPNFWILVIGRFLTGIGGGGFGAMASITLSDLVSMKQRGVYQGYNSLFYQSGAASGGLVAGFFQHYFGWRMAFLIQVPLSLITGFMIQVYFKLPPDSPGSGAHGGKTSEKFKRLDWVGTFLLVSSVFILMLAASMGGKEISFNSTIFKLLVSISLIGLVAFYQYELRFATEPILPVTLLYNKTILFSSIGSFFLNINSTSCFFYLPFYWTTVNNLSPLDAGMRLIPSTFTTAISALTAGYSIKRSLHTKTPFIWGCIFLICGSTWIYMSSINDPTWRDYVVRIPQTIGTSSNFNMMLISLIASVDPTEQALATSIQYAFRSTGSTLGASLSSAVLEYALRYYLNYNFGHLDNIPEEFKNHLDSIKNKALNDPKYMFESAPLFFKNTIVDSYDSACHAVFIFLITSAILTCFFGFAVPDHYLG